MNVDEIIDSEQIKPEKWRNKMKKDVLYRFDEMRIQNPKMKAEDISRQLGYSLSGISRMRKDIGDTQHTRKKVSPEKQQEINIKSARTRKMKKNFNEEHKSLQKQNLSIEEYDSKLEELREKYLSKTPKEPQEIQGVQNNKTRAVKRNEHKTGKGDDSNDPVFTKPEINFEEAWNKKI